MIAALQFMAFLLCWLVFEFSIIAVIIALIDSKMSHN